MKPDEILDEAARLASSAAGTGDDALRAVTALSVMVIDRCDAASVSLAGTGGVTTRAATSPIAEVLDEIQYRAQEGPCLDAISSGTISIPEPSDRQSRWPQFHRESQVHGLLGTLSAPVRVEQEIVGSLNLYALSARFELSERDELLSMVLASYAAMAVAADRHHTLTEQLNQALASRDIIGQAKGILIAREGCNSDQAFDMLRRASQRLNKKLRDVAEQIVESALAGPSSPRRG